MKLTAAEKADLARWREAEWARTSAALDRLVGPRKDSKVKPLYEPTASGRHPANPGHSIDAG